MTWLATGPVFAALGADVGLTNATATAFEGLVTADRRDLDDDLARRLAAAISRATWRWDGYADDEGVTPLGRPPRSSDEGRGPIAVEIDDQLAVADATFMGIVVPPGVEDVELQFVDDGRIAVRTGRSAAGPSGFRLGSSDGETYVLVDAFVGDNTIRQIALRKVVDGVARIRLRVTGQVAVLVGTVLRVAASARAAGAHDLTWNTRLTRQERIHRSVALAHPRIEHVAPDPREIGVFIHGTFSTCVPALAQIGGLSKIPLYRFEHDTMRPIAESARELVTELTRLGSRQVTLLGHSRGGLVATLAGAHVSSTTRVLTFGSPHRGTPLASAMDGLLGYGTVALGIPAGSVLAGGLTAALIGSALPGGRLPDGWTDMQPQGSFIQTLPLVDTTKVHAYGGVFDGGKGLGTTPAFSAEMMSALMQSANDLVVPVWSSKPSGLAGSTLDQVDHFSYFADSEVADVLEEALRGSPRKRLQSSS